MFKRKRTFAIVIAACLGTTLPAESYTANIVRNPGFETVFEGGIVADWDEPSKTFSYVKGEGRNGSTALKFTVKNGYAFPTQKVKVKPGKRYRFSAWVRTKNLYGKGNGASLYMICRGAGKVKLCNAFAHGVRGTVKEWRQISMSIDIPTNTVTCELSPLVTKNFCGIAWFDDIECVEEEKSVIIGQIVSNFYRDTASAGEAVFSAALSLGREDIAKRGLKTLFDIPQPNGDFRTINAEADGRIVRMKTDVAELPAGESKVSLRLVDGDGKIVESRSLMFNRVVKIPDWKVRIDENNRTLVDGKPFFPVGIYLTRFTEQAFLDISNSPFNCVMCYRRPACEELDRFHAAGKKVIYSIKGVFLGRESCPKEIVDEKTEREWVENHVREIKKHPALLAWYINDESGPMWVDRLKIRHDLVRQTDPDHPTFMVLYQINHLGEYSGTYDVLGTDPYPIGSRKRCPITTVEDWTRRTCRDAMGKAVWEVPQVFDNEIQNKIYPTKAPTEAEVKNMVWQCVAAGANGVCAFSYTALRTMDKKDPFVRRWAEVCRAYAEFVKYTSVFLSTEKAPNVTNMPQGVFARTFRHEGRIWLLTVNATYEAVDCCLSVDGCGVINVKLPALGVDMRRL